LGGQQVTDGCKKTDFERLSWAILKKVCCVEPFSTATMPKAWDSPKNKTG
jgi:hypothetical protein